MGGMSIWHLIIIGLIVLVIFGPGRLPGLGKSMGEAIRGFKKGLDGINDEIDVTNTRPDQLKPGNETNTQAQGQNQTQKQKQDT